MEIIPREGYVVLKEADAIKDESAASAIILPDSMQGEELTNQGKVVKLPLGYTGDLEENTPVIFKRHLFEEVIIDRKTYLLGKQECVIAVLYIPQLEEKK